MVTDFFDFLVWHPERAAVVALLFFAAALIMAVLQWRSRRFRSWPCLAATVVWALYGVWEWYAHTKRWNIRVDLLVLYPMLLMVSVSAALLSYRWKSPPKAAN